MSQVKGILGCPQREKSWPPGSLAISLCPKGHSAYWAERHMTGDLDRGSEITAVNWIIHLEAAG